MISGDSKLHAKARIKERRLRSPRPVATSARPTSCGPQLTINRDKAPIAEVSLYSSVRISQSSGKKR